MTSLPSKLARLREQVCGIVQAEIVPAGHEREGGVPGGGDSDGRSVVALITREEAAGHGRGEARVPGGGDSGGRSVVALITREEAAGHGRGEARVPVP